MVCHHDDTFGDHRHYNSEDMMFLICHVVSHDYMVKGLCEFIGNVTHCSKSPPYHVWWPNGLQQAEIQNIQLVT